jgi:hypothetical protein
MVILMVDVFEVAAGKALFDCSESMPPRFG